jgi:hypothetical protein
MIPQAFTPARLFAAAPRAEGPDTDGHEALRVALCLTVG